jgi:hypothetical protein
MGAAEGRNVGEPVVGWAVGLAVTGLEVVGLDEGRRLHAEFAQKHDEYATQETLVFSAKQDPPGGRALALAGEVFSARSRAMVSAKAQTGWRRMQEVGEVAVFAGRGRVARNVHACAAGQRVGRTGRGAGKAEARVDAGERARVRRERRRAVRAGGPLFGS